MKTFFFLMLLSFAFVACNDDDENEKEVSIVGDWQGDRLDVKATSGFIALYEEKDEDFDGTLKFLPDKTVVYTRNSVESTGTYTLADGKLTTDADLQLYNVSGPVTFDVIILTANRLQLRANETRQVTVPDVGEVPVTVTALIDFTR